MVACSTCAGAGDDAGNRSEDCDPAKNRNGAVKPVDQTTDSLRLGDDPIDLMTAFSLSSSHGVGGAWEIPPYLASADTFDGRYGRW